MKLRATVKSYEHKYNQYILSPMTLNSLPGMSYKKYLQKIEAFKNRIKYLK